MAGLRERWTKNAVTYNFEVEKSSVVCIIGENSADKTKLLEMLAGKRLCEGSIEIRDSDFYAGGNKPKLANFVAYRPSDVVLDDYMTAL